MKTERPASHLQSLKDIFPGKTSGEFRTAMSQLKKDVKAFRDNYAEGIADLDGQGLLTAFQQYESILSQAGALHSYVDLRHITVEKNDDWARKTQKKLNDAARDTLFFKSEIAALPEFELLDRMAEEPKLAAYTPWLRLHRSYSGTVYEEEVECYLHDQAHKHPDLKDIWAKLAAPVSDGNAAPLLQALREESDPDKRRDIFAKFAAEAEEDTETLMQLLSNRMRSTGAEAAIRGFDTPEKAFTAQSQTPEDVPHKMMKALTGKLPQIAAKFYKRKAQQAGVPRLHPADLLHIPAPETKEEAWEKTAQPALEKLFPKNDGTLKVLDGQNSGSGTPLRPMKLFIMPDDRPSYLCLDGTPAPLERMILTAGGIGRDIQRDHAAKNNTPLTAKPLPGFETLAGHAAEFAALDALIDAANDPAEKRDLIAYQIERSLLTLSLSAAVTACDRALNDLSEKQGTLSVDEAKKLWKASLQNAFGPAVDYDAPGLDMLWVEAPYMLSDTADALQDMFGLTLAAKLMHDRKDSSDPAAENKKFADFLAAGSSKQGKPLLKTLGIDITDEQTWQDGVSLLEKRLEQLTALDKQLAADKPVQKPAAQKKKGGPSA
jgi:oligoendopeptidase F